MSKISVQQMVTVKQKIINKRGRVNKYRSPVVFHSKITMFSAWRPRNIMQTEGEGNI